MGGRGGEGNENPNYLEFIQLREMMKEIGLHLIVAFLDRLKADMTQCH
jgi:hypothetical protein